MRYRDKWTEMEAIPLGEGNHISGPSKLPVRTSFGERSTEECGVFITVAEATNVSLRWHHFGADRSEPNGLFWWRYLPVLSAVGPSKEAQRHWPSATRIK